MSRGEAAAQPQDDAPEAVPARQRGRVWQRPGRVGRWWRRALYFPALGAIFVAYEIALRAWAVPCPVTRWPVRAHRFNVLIRSFGRALARLTQGLLGTSVEVRGSVPPGRFVVISNHQSAADIAFLLDCLDPLHVKFVAKSSLRAWIPSVSTALRYGGAALVSRDGGREDLRALVTMARGLERWEGSALIFAEGTRARGGSLAPYQVAGVRVLARESGLPLLPVCIEGTHPAADVASLARGLLGARVVITIGEPVAAPTRGRALAEVLGDIEDWNAAVIEALRAQGATPRPADGRERDVA